MGREKPGRKNLRYLFHLLLVASLMMMALRPQLLSSKGQETTLVLTQGYDTNDLDSLRKVYPSAKIYATGLDTLEYQHLMDLDPESSVNIFVLGWGLEPYESEYLKDCSAVFLPARIDAGIIAIEYPRVIIRNKRIALSGILKCDAAAKLILSSAEGQLDSAAFDAAGIYDFTFAIRPRISGRHIYEIELVTEGNEKRIERITVIVQPENLLNVLVLNSFPTFESKYLKQLLTEAGHAMTIRNQISKDRFKYEYHNSSARPVLIMGAQSLRDFDVLMIDQRGFQSLSGEKKDVIKQLVYRDGMGLIINGVDNPNKLKEYDLFKGYEFEEVLNENFKIEVFGTQITAPTWAISNSRNIPIWQTANGEIVSAYQLYGLGKVEVMLENHTYELILKGKQKAYSEFWSAHLDLFLSRRHEHDEWQFQNPIPMVNEPLHFFIKTAQTQVPEIRHDSLRIPMLQDIDFAEKWYGTTWPDKSGWNKLVTENFESEQWFYVFDDNDWQTLRQHEKVKYTHRTLALNKLNTAKKIVPASYKPINPLWFFGLFILSAAFIWLEPKI